jgi:hypothetical protein
MFKFILDYINSIPFSLSIKHYQNFGSTHNLMKNNELNSKESWDVLRETHPQFSISENREEWIKACNAQIKKDGQDGGLILRAKDVCSLIVDKGYDKVFSVGVGGAGLEYQIKKNLPNINLICSEFSENNVKSLQKVFMECNEIIQFDILNGDWGSIGKKYFQNNNSVLIMYRLDAGFSDSEWKKIFEKIHNAEIKNIIYIPTGILTILSLYNRKKREVKWLINRDPVSFSGYIRNKKVFQDYWRSYYDEELLNFGGLKGFLLKTKQINN